MQTGAPSGTAITVALFRAAHLHLFDDPKIHADTFALQISGAKDVEDVRVRLTKRYPLDLQRVSAYFALRHRFSEDQMRASLHRGVRQVVLLGAGLDSLALREPSLASRVTLVEIDHPDSQQWKLDRLRALGLNTPGVKYVPVDFASQDLKTELASAGIQASEPTFFAWLGVTQYISEDACMATLSLIARHAPGSEIVFDVILPFEGLASDELRISSAARVSAEVRGEPWITFFRPEEIRPRLLDLGFGDVVTLTAEEARQYYLGQPAGVAPLTAWQLMSGVV
jgi:methyltransferase (TIGR00027 family)